MAEAGNQRTVSVARLLLAVGLSGILSHAEMAAADSPTRPAQTGQYLFLSDQSTVTVTGDSPSVYGVSKIQGQFTLTVDSAAGTASFDAVDAHVIGRSRFIKSSDLDELFAMRELVTTSVNGEIIELRAENADGEETLLTVTLTAEGARLTGTITTRGCDDCFEYSLEAVAARLYGGGTGGPNTPYLIYTPEQMNAIGAKPGDWNKHFKLMADIDLSSLANQFHMIGKDPGTPFTGVFDGNNHTIANFVAETGGENIGLFAVVADPNAEIRNLTLLSPRIKSWEAKAGSLVGLLRHGTLFNCHARDVEVNSLSWWVGGLVGANGTEPRFFEDLTVVIRNCSCTGRVAGGFGSLAGGLVGEAWGGIFYDCFATCEVSGEYAVGGFAGRAGGIRFTNCYATGIARGGVLVGGLIGHCLVGKVLNCYSACRVSGTENVGGLMGYADESRVAICFSCLWDAEISNRLDYAGATGRTTAQMQDPNTFIALGWDFAGPADGPSDVWALPAGGGYPILWWQLPEFPEPPFAGGTGEANDPYVIETARQLSSIGSNPRFVSAHFRLAGDIDMTGVQFYPIGSDGYPYSGVFDGRGFSIANLTYATADTGRVGLFRVIEGDRAEVRDLSLVDPSITAPGGLYVGSLAGVLREGKLLNCHVTGGRVSAARYVGGLVGVMEGEKDGWGPVDTELLRCTATASVTGSEVVGGLVGMNTNQATVTRCQAAGEIMGGLDVGGLAGVNHWAQIINCAAGGRVDGEQWVGGLVGQNMNAVVQGSLSRAGVEGHSYVGGLVGLNWGTITDSYSAGEVIGNTDVGGLAGRNGRLDPVSVLWPGTISKCYAAGPVARSSFAGGLVGYQLLGPVTASFWDIEASGLPASPEGAGRATAQMRTASTFLAAGWDFVGETENGTEDIWWILEGQDYPRLNWEKESP